MKSFHPFTAVACLTLFLHFAGSVSAQELARQELAIPFAPNKLVRETVQGELSVHGRFVILPGDDRVLVIDSPEIIAAVQIALAKMEVPQPDVQLDFAFRAHIPEDRGPERFGKFDGFGNFVYQGEGRDVFRQQLPASAR